MLYVKGDYYLNEFIAALKHAIELALPLENQADTQMKDEDDNNNASQKDFANNLYEHYPNYDLSFLKGYAIIIPAAELRVLNKQDDVIRLLHPYYSSEFEHCGNNHERRLDALFEIKDKWTYSELSLYLKNFTDVGVNFDNYLLKNTKILKEKNPFNQEKEITFYLRKF